MIKSVQVCITLIVYGMCTNVKWIRDGQQLKFHVTIYHENNHHKYHDIIMFFIRNLKHPHEGFNINNYISFASGDTRASANYKLQHNRSSTNTMNNFYFNRLPRLWNALPVINPALDTLVIKHKLSQYMEQLQQ